MKRIMVLLVSFALGAQEERKLIESVSVHKNEVRIKVNKEFKKKYLLDDFFAVYDEDVDISQLDESVLVLPFVMNVISIIWISGKDYYIDSIDEDVYKSLDTIKEVFNRMYKKTKWNGRLIAKNVVKNKPPFSLEENKMALLLSGGLDSITSSLYHRDKKQLLVTIWGHWDMPLHDKEILRKRKKQLTAFGSEYGHENSFVSSNYYSFLNRPVLDAISPEISSWRIFTVEGIGWAGLCAPLMLIKGYPELRQASTVTWDFDYPACANPFVDDNIRFAGLQMRHDLFDMNRLEKCEYIVDLCKRGIVKKPYIRVCEEINAHNCCRCQKCIRTILEFIIAGDDPQDYGFNIDPQIALKKSEGFMKDHYHANGYTTIWHFMHIQDRMRERKKRGEAIPQELEWILHVDLSKKSSPEVRHQRKINWHEFEDLLPGVEIPCTKK